VEIATTEQPRLTGLEVAETKPELKPEHWIERGPSKRLMLFSGRSHPALAQRIAEKLGIQVGDVSLRTFADGNTYCRYEESIRGADLFIVQTSSRPVDQHLMELLIMIDAAKLASAKRITAVLPLYPYSRQDKKSRPREGITAKLVAEMIQTPVCRSRGSITVSAVKNGSLGERRDYQPVPGGQDLFVAAGPDALRSHRE